MSAVPARACTPVPPPHFNVLTRPCGPHRHENGILLDKLSKILTREKSAQAGGAKLPSVSSSSSTGLHDIYRRKVREQIDRENQSLLRRLQYMKPSIDMVQFEQQWQASSQFASMNRSQGNRNPVIASPPRRQSAQRRPQTVPTNAPSDRRPRSAAIGGRAQTPAHYSGGRAQTPAHYLQPLYSERELAAFPSAETAAEEALYAELEAEDADEPPQPALGDLGASAAN